jgi:hypothetical protein
MPWVHPRKPVFRRQPGPVVLQQGDKLLLCSDGSLGNSLTDDQKSSKQLSAKGVSDAVPDLVPRVPCAKPVGQHSDNVTVLAMEWETA